ncbi:MAG: hypothetical protein ABFS41_11890 [Myxococcota bacterium]
MRWILRVLLALALLVVAIGVGARFADGPLAIVAGGPFRSGERVVGPEPDWSFVREIRERSGAQICAAMHATHAALRAGEYERAVRSRTVTRSVDRFQIGACVWVRDRPSALPLSPPPFLLPSFLLLR